MKYIFLFILITCLGFKHPLYISTVNFNQNTTTKNIEISVRSFTDDVEAILKQNTHTTIDLNNEKNMAINNTAINNYLQSKLAVSINNRTQSIRWVGYEIIKESVWIYAEIVPTESVKLIHINCQWLYDFTNKQSNIISTNINNKEESYKLDYPNKTIDFKY